MKDFEKFLTDLPKPAVDVPVFREELRRELAGLERSGIDSRWRVAALLGGALAAMLTVVLTLFVVRPQIPASLHASFAGDARPAESSAALTAIDDDRAFIESWNAQQAQPAAVRAMEGERLVRVRQFEMTDGKRVLVFSELNEGETSQQQAVPVPSRRASSSGAVF